jgi:FAD synthetase
MIDEVESLTDKYIRAVELALGEVTPKSEAPHPEVESIIDAADRYLTDAKYYLNTGKKATALASVSYAEGMLDALKILGFVRFEWRSASRS